MVPLVSARHVLKKCKRKGGVIKMETIKAKAMQTRERNQAARAALLQEQAETTRVARQALQRVFENSDATPEEVLRAAELLATLSSTRRC